MPLKVKIAIGLAMAASFALGDYQATLRGKAKRKNIIDYYETELTKDYMYADALDWVKDNIHKMSAEDFKKGLHQRLLFVRVNAKNEEINCG